MSDPVDHIGRKSPQADGAGVTGSDSSKTDASIQREILRRTLIGLEEDLDDLRDELADGLESYESRLSSHTNGLPDWLLIDASALRALFKLPDEFGQAILGPRAVAIGAARVESFIHRWIGQGDALVELDPAADESFESDRDALKTFLDELETSSREGALDAGGQLGDWLDEILTELDDKREADATALRELIGTGDVDRGNHARREVADLWEEQRERAAELRAAWEPIENLVFEGVDLTVDGVGELRGMLRRALEGLQGSGLQTSSEVEDASSETMPGAMYLENEGDADSPGHAIEDAVRHTEPLQSSTATMPYLRKPKRQKGKPVIVAEEADEAEAEAEEAEVAVEAEAAGEAEPVVEVEAAVEAEPVGADEEIADVEAGEETEDVADEEAAEPDEEIDDVDDEVDDAVEADAAVESDADEVDEVDDAESDTILDLKASDVAAAALEEDSDASDIVDESAEFETEKIDISALGTDLDDAAIDADSDDPEVEHSLDDDDPTHVDEADLEEPDETDSDDSDDSDDSEDASTSDSDAESTDAAESLRFNGEGFRVVSSWDPIPTSEIVLALGLPGLFFLVLGYGALARTTRLAQIGPDPFDVWPWAWPWGFIIASTYLFIFMVARHWRPMWRGWRLVPVQWREHREDLGIEVDPESLRLGTLKLRWDHVETVETRWESRPDGTFGWMVRIQPRNTSSVVLAASERNYTRWEQSSAAVTDVPDDVWQVSGGLLNAIREQTR